MMYSSEYIESKDIDWFFRIGDMNIHVASAGGDIPDIVNDREQLREIQHNVSMLEDIYTDEQIIINESMMSELESMYSRENNKFSRDDYLESFKAMARKGFISMDKTKINDNNDDRYHIVCMPNSNEKTPIIEGIPIVPIPDFPYTRFNWVKKFAHEFKPFLSFVKIVNHLTSKNKK